MSLDDLFKWISMCFELLFGSSSQYGSVSQYLSTMETASLILLSSIRTTIIHFHVTGSSGFRLGNMTKTTILSIPLYHTKPNALIPYIPPYSLPPSLFLTSLHIPYLPPLH